MPVHAIIFDLGGTLIDWPDWDADVKRRWALSYDYLTSTLPAKDWPDRDAYIQAMLQAEHNHWQRVVQIQASSTPEALLQEGFQLLGYPVTEQELLNALDGYARAVNGWAIVFPDSLPTLIALRQQGYKLGLLSNTWWAAAWHNADLATHGLQPLFHEVVYTSDLPYSKPHPKTFLTVTERLNVQPTNCVMVGDRLIDDISGALALGIRAVWKENTSPWPKPAHITPTATIPTLAALLPLLQQWQEETQ